MLVGAISLQVRPRPLVSGALVVVIALVASVSVRAARAVQDPDGLVPRSPSHLQCSGQHPRVCLWPEQRDQRQGVTRAMSAALSVFAASGLTAPEELSADPHAVARYEMPPGQRPPREVENAVLAALVVPPYPACADSQR